MRKTNRLSRHYLPIKFLRSIASFQNGKPGPTHKGSLVPQGVIIQQNQFKARHVPNAQPMSSWPPRCLNLPSQRPNIITINKPSALTAPLQQCCRTLYTTQTCHAISFPYFDKHGRIPIHQQTLLGLCHVGYSIGTHTVFRPYHYPTNASFGCRYPSLASNFSSQVAHPTRLDTAHLRRNGCTEATFSGL